MELIIGDIGNTFSKICLVNKETSKIKKIFNFQTSKLKTKKGVKNFFKNKKFDKFSIDKAFFSCVVPSVYTLIKFFLKKEFKISTFDIKDKKLKKVVKINIKKPKQAGSDRIANASAAYKIYKSDCIIVDFGTATTFDVVTKKGVYNGGVIAPGIELSMKVLHQSTSLLPFLKIKRIKKIIGKNTNEAMQSGFYWGYLGLILNIINRIKKESKKNYKIICTGGLSKLFAKSININTIIDNNLTINGIIEVYKLNKKIN
jgi:type III pantothenate kinase